MNNSVPPSKSLRATALAAAAGVAFLGFLVFLASAWGFADAGHPVWAVSFLGAAAACATIFRLASKAGSGKPRPASSNRVALERLLPLPAGIEPAARAALRADIRRLAFVTAGSLAAVAFGMLAWQYGAAGRPQWAAAAALCAAAGAALLVFAYIRPARIAG